MNTSCGRIARWCTVLVVASCGARALPDADAADTPNDVQQVDETNSSTDAWMEETDLATPQDDVSVPGDVLQDALPEVTPSDADVDADAAMADVDGGEDTVADGQDATITDSGTAGDASSGDADIAAVDVAEACTQPVLPIPKPVTPGYVDDVSFQPIPCKKSNQCDDGNPCTDDECTTGGSCVYKFNSAPCEDPCGSANGICSKGTCGVPVTGDAWTRRVFDMGETRTASVLEDGSIVLSTAYRNIRILPDGTTAWRRGWGGGIASVATPGGVAIVGGLFSIDRYNLAGSELFDPILALGIQPYAVDVAMQGCGLIAVGADMTKVEYPPLVESDPMGVIHQVLPDGTPGWSLTSGAVGHFYTGVAVLSDGTIVTVGSGALNVNNQTLDGIASLEVSAFSKTGKQLWTSVVDAAEGAGLGITVGANDAIYVRGAQPDGAKGSQVVLYKLTSDGKLIWKTKWRYRAPGNFFLYDPGESALDGKLVSLQNDRVLIATSVFQKGPVQKLSKIIAVANKDGNWIEESVLDSDDFIAGLSVTSLSNGSEKTIEVTRAGKIAIGHGGFDQCGASGLCDGMKLGDCSDGNHCTMDHCDPKVGCVHQAYENGAACGYDKQCIGGTCK